MPGLSAYRLHCFAQSGHSYKVALLLSLMSQPFERVWIDFFNGGVRSDDYTSMNVMAEAPVLEYGPMRLSQSGVIMDYLIRTHFQFGPQSREDELEVLRWVLWDNHKLSANAGTVRFLMNFLPEEKRSADVIAFLSGRLQAALKVLETQLEGRDWVAADYPTAADLSCCSYLFYPEEFGFDRKDWPNIDRWLSNVSTLPGWKHPYDLMPGAPGSWTRS